MTDLEKLKDENAALRELLNLPKQDNEGTSYPWWVIVIPRQIMKPCVHAIAGCIKGPYFSRQAAQRHLDSRRYEYGDAAIVYCMSGYWSNEYRDVVEASHMTPNEK